MKGPRITKWSMFAAFLTLVLTVLLASHFGAMTPDERTVYAIGFLGGMFALRSWADEDEVKP